MHLIDTGGPGGAETVYLSLLGLGKNAVSALYPSYRTTDGLRSRSENLALNLSFCLHEAPSISVSCVTSNGSRECIELISFMRTSWEPVSMQLYWVCSLADESSLFSMALRIWPESGCWTASSAGCFAASM